MYTACSLSRARIHSWPAAYVFSYGVNSCPCTVFASRPYGHGSDVIISLQPRSHMRLLSDICSRFLVKYARALVDCCCVHITDVTLLYAVPFFPQFHFVLILSLPSRNLHCKPALSLGPRTADIDSRTVAPLFIQRSHHDR